MFGDQVIRQLIVVFQFDLGQNLETDQPGGASKVGDGNSGYEDEGTFRRDPEWIPP